ncbi:MAG: hypothetical protein ABIP13_06835 [Tepidiformaceae bacterium]
MENGDIMAPWTEASIVRSIHTARLAAVVVAAVVVVVLAATLLHHRENPPATSSTTDVTATLSSPTPTPTLDPALGYAVRLPSGFSVLATPESQYGQVPLLYDLHAGAEGKVTHDLLFDGRGLRVGGETWGFSVGFDESKRSIAVAACVTEECGYGGGGLDRGESVVLLSPDGGATWREVGRIAGDGYIAGVKDGEVLVGDRQNSASTLANRMWRWLPSGRPQPTPFPDRQGASARVIPGSGLTWHYPTSPYYASDGTIVSPEGSVPIGSLSGVSYFWGEGVCSPSTQTQCVRTHDRSRVQVVVPWEGPPDCGLKQ